MTPTGTRDTDRGATAPPEARPAEGSATADELASLSFETAFRALEEAVARLEAGELSLEEALVAYEKGVALAERCDALLAAAELRVRQVDAEGRDVGAVKIAQ